MVDIEKQYSILAHKEDLFNYAKNNSNRFKTLLETLKQKYNKNDLENILNHKDKNGNTALINAAYNGHLNIVKELLNADPKANINVKGKNGDTALIEAAKKGHLDIVEYLLNADPKANINVKNNYDDTALAWAAYNGRADIVEYLLNANPKADINVRNKNGDTALIEAAKKGHLSIVYKLLNADPKANINVRNKNGDTALAWAAKKGHFSIVEYLLKNNANLLNHDISISMQNNIYKLLHQTKKQRINNLRLLKKTFQEKFDKDATFKQKIEETYKAQEKTNDQAQKTATIDARTYWEWFVDSFINRWILGKDNTYRAEYNRLYSYIENNHPDFAKLIMSTQTITKEALNDLSENKPVKSETQVFEHNNFNTSRIDSYTVPSAPPPPSELLEDEPSVVKIPQDRAKDYKPSAPSFSELREDKLVEVKNKPNTTQIYKKSVSSLNPTSTPKMPSVKQRKVRKR